MQLYPFAAQSSASTVRQFLHPGEIVFGDQSLRVHTLLGSCVAVTIWHPEKKVGGMCHIVLPSSNLNSTNSPVLKRPEGYYADWAFAWLKNEALSHGLPLSEFQTKAFGGSNAIDLPEDQNIENIGTNNIKTVFSLITQHQMKLIAHDVGKKGSRKIEFDISTGDVWVKHQQLI